MGKSIYNQNIFVNLLKAAEQYSKDDNRYYIMQKNAYAYRKRILWEDYPEYLKSELTERGLLKKEYDIESLRKLLKENEIKFFPWANIEKLITLCKDNNLIEA